MTEPHTMARADSDAQVCSTPAPRPHWLDELARNLRDRAERSLLRSLRTVERHGPMARLDDGRELLDLSGNDYLGLAQHPRIIRAATDATVRCGTGAGASRLVSGHHPWHARVEERFARFKHAQAALLCPTGYTANLAVLTTLAGPGDRVLCDKLNHASLLDAARSSGATMRLFPHRDYDKAERLMQRFRQRPATQPAPDDRGDADIGPRITPPTGRSPRLFLVTDSVFSMDGDCADLPRCCDLADRYGAILVVDEAHGTGVLGATGGGLCEAQGVAERVHLVVSTASKALGSLGGIVTAGRVVIDSLINHARSFIYTTAVPPAQAAAIDAALDVIEAEPARRHRLRQLSEHLAHELRRLASNRYPPRPPTGSDQRSALSDQRFPTPILPVLAHSAAAAVALSEHLERHGILAPAIRPPTVAPNAARVRLSLRADLEDRHIAQLLDALARWYPG